MALDANNSNPASNGDVAPDDAPGGKYGYRLGHKKGSYEVPDITLNSYDRKIKIITIGAGISGIYMSYLIQKYGENIDHAVYEKNGDIGGTWLENRYPGCACDVPSHSYAFGFALNPDWPKFLSSSEDIFRYLDRVVECFGLRRYMSFNSTVVGAEWHEAEGKWHVRIQDSASGEVREDAGEVLVSASGVLNAWKFPEEVEGLRSFQGRLVHTARWPDDYGAERWKEDRVALLGSGATSLQVLPTMQPHTKSIDVFVRTPVWFVDIGDSGGDNFEYTNQDRDTLKGDLEALVKKAKDIEGSINTAAYLKSLMVHSAEARASRDLCTSRMRMGLQRDELFSELLPDFAVGCRRPTPGKPYMRAVQEPNVRMHRTAVTRVNPHSVVGADGTEVEVDTIVCATGFDVSFRPRFPVVGRDGAELGERWREVPEGYLSLGVPDFPNYFTVIGPTFPIANGSVMGPLQAVGRYILQVVQKMQRERIHSLAPRHDVTDAFNAHTQAWVSGTAWADPRCRSWYKNNATGRVNAIWPGGSLHFCEAVAEPRYEDFEIRYREGGNMWEFLGLGFTKSMLAEEADLSPYMSLENIDMDFVRYVPDKDAEDERVSRLGLMVSDGPEVQKGAAVNGSNGDLEK